MCSKDKFVLNYHKRNHFRSFSGTIPEEEAGVDFLLSNPIQSGKNLFPYEFLHRNVNGTLVFYQPKMIEGYEVESSAPLDNIDEYVKVPRIQSVPVTAINIRNVVRRLFARLCLVFSDMIGLVIAIALGFQIRISVLPAILPVFPPERPQPLSDKIWWLLGVVFICLAFERLYTRRLPFWRESKRVLKAVTLAFVLIFAGVSLAKLSGEVSRTVIVITYFSALMLLPLLRYLTKSLLAAAGIWQEYVLILGIGNTAQKIAANLEKDRYLGYRIYGFLKQQEERQKIVKINSQDFPVIGDFGDAQRILVEARIRQVIISAPNLSGDELVLFTNELQPYTNSILIVPDLAGIPVVGGETEYFFDDRILAYRTKNNLASPGNQLIKRLFDIFVCLILSIVIIPLLVIIAVAIKLDSKGPIIFSHNRVGYRGKDFKCYKYRTMVANSQQVLEEMFETNPDLQQQWEEDFKLKNDPRITRVGKILRKTSLDELPQIFNVLKCEMSLVGPRPIVRGEIHKFGPHIKEYLMVRPGMTGLWVNSGRNDVDYDERVQMETWYVRNWSLWMDISLLFRTIPVVLGRKGAY